MQIITITFEHAYIIAVHNDNDDSNNLSCLGIALLAPFICPVDTVVTKLPNAPNEIRIFPFSLIVLRKEKNTQSLFPSLEKSKKKKRPTESPNDCVKSTSKFRAYCHVQSRRALDPIPVRRFT